MDKMMTWAEAVAYIVRAGGLSLQQAKTWLGDAVRARQIAFTAEDDTVTNVSTFDVLRTWPEHKARVPAATITLPSDRPGVLMNWRLAVAHVAEVTGGTDTAAAALLGNFVEAGEIGYWTGGAPAMFPFAAWAEQNPVCLYKDDVVGHWPEPALCSQNAEQTVNVTMETAGKGAYIPGAANEAEAPAWLIDAVQGRKFAPTTQDESNPMNENNEIRTAAEAGIGPWMTWRNAVGYIKSQTQGAFGVMRGYTYEGAWETLVVAVQGGDLPIWNDTFPGDDLRNYIAFNPEEKWPLVPVESVTELSARIVAELGRKYLTEDAAARTAEHAEKAQEAQQRHDGVKVILAMRRKLLDGLNDWMAEAGEFLSEHQTQELADHLVVELVR